MKLFSFEWIHPLQKRVKEKLPTESHFVLKAWSVIFPMLLYYMVNTLLRLLGMASVISMLIAAVVVLKIFMEEKAQIKIPDSHTKEIPIVFILGAASALFFNILFALLQITGSSQEYAEVAQRQFAFPLWEAILIYGIVSPIAEEMVFRGIVYNRLDRLFDRTIAIIGSALLFGGYHGNLVQALYGFILGLLIGVLYERYGSFAVPVLIHSAANICVYIVSSDAILQQKFMNWTGCIACGILVVVLFWLLVLRKEKVVIPDM